MPGKWSKRIGAGIERTRERRRRRKRSIRGADVSRQSLTYQSLPLPSLPSSFICAIEAKEGVGGKLKGREEKVQEWEGSGTEEEGDRCSTPSLSPHRGERNRPRFIDLVRGEMEARNLPPSLQGQPNCHKLHGMGSLSHFRQWPVFFCPC